MTIEYDNRYYKPKEKCYYRMGYAWGYGTITSNPVFVQYKKWYQDSDFMVQQKRGAFLP